MQPYKDKGPSISRSFEYTRTPFPPFFKYTKICVGAPARLFGYGMTFFVCIFVLWKIMSRLSIICRRPCLRQKECRPPCSVTTYGEVLCREINGVSSGTTWRHSGYRAKIICLLSGGHTVTMYMPPLLLLRRRVFPCG